MTDAIVSGTCYVLLAYDVGQGIRLEEAADRVDGWTRGAGGDRLQPPGRYLDFKHPPLRARARVEPITLGETATLGEVEAVIFDFGAVALTYQIALEGPLSGLVSLSAALYESTELLAASRQHLDELLDAIGPAVDRRRVGRFVEDYAIFHVAELGGDGKTSPASEREPAQLVHAHRGTWARILRAEPRPLSEQEISDALASRIAYGVRDEAIVDWNATILLFPDDLQDIRTVLEYANVQLLEMRWLDEQLDMALEGSYEILARRGAAGSWRRRFPLVPFREIHRVAQLQTDGAVLFEGVTNALKLVGDQYLARLYRMAAQRMRLSEWDQSIARKLQTAESIYQKLSDQASTVRLEVLEWIIIVLIAVSIVLAL